MTQTDDLHAAPFAPHEMAARLNETRNGMKRAGIDLLLVTDLDDICYLTSARQITVDVPAFMFPTLIVTATEMAICARTIDVMSVEGAPGVTRAFPCEDFEEFTVVLAGAMAELAAEDATIGFAAQGWNFPIASYEKVRSLLPRTAWVDGSDLVWDQRRVKSASEIEHTRVAAGINAVVFDAFIDSVTPGVTDGQLAGVLHDSLYRSGSHEQHFHMVKVGNASTAHDTMTGQRVQQHDQVILEFSASRYGYIAPILRTIAVGTPSKELRFLHDAALSGLDAAISAMKPGVTAGHVDDVANDAYEQLGVREFHRTRTGYSVGLSWPEGHIAELTTNSTMELREGMVFHVIGALLMPRDPAQGRDDVTIVSVSESVVITANGAQPLNSIPRKLIEL